MCVYTLPSYITDDHRMIPKESGNGVGTTSSTGADAQKNSVIMHRSSHRKENMAQQIYSTYLGTYLLSSLPAIDFLAGDDLCVHPLPYFAPTFARFL